MRRSELRQRQSGPNLGTSRYYGLRCRPAITPSSFPCRFLVSACRFKLTDMGAAPAEVPCGDHGPI